MPREYTRRSLAERFFEKVERAGPLMRPELGRCWGWNAFVNRGGYGYIRRGRLGEKGTEYANRVSWELHYGPIPEGLCVLHRCDNPTCTRPDHLFLGTKPINNHDMWAKGRGKAPAGRPGESNSSAKLTHAEVVEIRRLYAAGGISQVRLALRFHCSQTQISRVIRGASWSTQ